MKTGSKVLVAIGVLLCVISAWQFASAAYIHAKAEFARWLVLDAWHRVQQGEARARPWPWADTWPVARLSVPALDEQHMVLAGASGRTLAFGPGWMQASARPGSHGVSVIGGHRDTHFEFLQYLVPGDVIRIDSGTSVTNYRVRESRVVDSSKETLSLHSGFDALVLVTCYPFNALSPGGPLRYLVYADPVVGPNG